MRINRIVYAVLIIACVNSANAGFLDWLIPTAHAPDEKHAIALGYGLSGGELGSVKGDDVTDKTKEKFKQAAQALPYAELSDAVYAGKQSIGNGEWERINDKSGSMGFHASTYRNKKTNQIVIAYQGTCAGGGIKSCVGDLVTDIVGLVVPSPQQTQAVEYAKEIINKYGGDIQVTGHSLGGGLAQTTAAVFGLKAVTFNSATVNWTTKALTAAFNQQTIGEPNIVNYVMTGDPVNPASKVFGLAGKDYGKNVYLDFDIPKIAGEHGLGDMIAALNSMTNYYNNILSINQSTQTSVNPCTTKNYVCAPVLSNVISGINQGSNSHFGASNLYTGWKTANSTPEILPVVNPQNNNNAQQTTGLQQLAQSTNTVAFKSSDWTVISGYPTTHYSFGNSFGPITAPNGGPIAALNNTNVQETVMQKVFTIPTGVKQVTVGMMANFVTNEYPVYVGSQFNDKATIQITTGSGNIYQATLFNKELNSANFSSVSGLPSPMMITGGQTGFENINKTIPVANGGQLTITVKTTNVGDTAYPSATLVNSTSVK